MNVSPFDLVTLELQNIRKIESNKKIVLEKVCAKLVGIEKR